MAKSKNGKFTMADKIVIDRTVMIVTGMGIHPDGGMGYFVQELNVEGGHTIKDSEFIHESRLMPLADYKKMINDL